MDEPARAHVIAALQQQGARYNPRNDAYCDQLADMVLPVLVELERQAWERGHASCVCLRPGATPCRNPYGESDAIMAEHSAEPVAYVSYPDESVAAWTAIITQQRQRDNNGSTNERGTT